jgi:predicted regulator of Ras-like GTPase activity (Roadblock/LC7/MglB family)
MRRGLDGSFDNANRLNPEAVAVIETLLQEIKSSPTVLGAAVIGHDGQLVAHNFPDDYDLKVLFEFAREVFAESNQVIQRFGDYELRQVVLSAASHQFAFADFGGGVLATVSSASEAR